MKMNRLILLSILLILSSYSRSQTVNDIFDQASDNIIWLGVDFTQVKYVGPTGTVSNDEFISFFNKINIQLITEIKEFNLAKALRKPNVPYDISGVNENNSRIDATNIVVVSNISTKKEITEEEIAALVRNYKFDMPGYIGLVFFMETIDKTRERGTMWVTFFNLTDHEILLTKRMEGKAGGFGFRNHWSETAKYVLKQIKSRKYEEWYDNTLNIR